MELALMPQHVPSSDGTVTVTGTTNKEVVLDAVRVDAVNSRTNSEVERLSPWAKRVALLKSNIPSIISLISVILNVVIISALIPNLRNDVTYMQGQTKSIGDQVNSMQKSLLELQQSIDGADTRIATFYANLATFDQSFNATQVQIASSQAAAQMELGRMQNSSATITANFQATSSTLEDQIASVQATLVNLVALNRTVVESLQSTASDLTNNVVPALLDELQSQNCSLRINAMAKGFTSTTFLPNVTGSNSTGPVIYFDRRSRMVQFGSIIMYSFVVAGALTSATTGSLYISLPPAAAALVTNDGLVVVEAASYGVIGAYGNITNSFVRNSVWILWFDSQQGWVLCLSNPVDWGCLPAAPNAFNLQGNILLLLGS